MKTVLGSSESSKGKKKRNVDPKKGNDEHDHDKPKRAGRHHRHSPEQIQALEALFKDCPHPDEQQRMELGKQISLESTQIKIWFQNRRSQLKAQMEDYENILLRQENEKLTAEGIAIKNKLANLICSDCGGPMKFGEPTIEELHSRIENARLRDELRRVRALSAEFLVRSNSTSTNTVSPPPPNLSSNLETIGSGVVNTSEFVDGVLNSLESYVRNHQSPLMNLAKSAMQELIIMVHMGEPLWIKDIESGKEVLNYENYLQFFPQCIGVKPADFVYEATRDTGMLIISGVELVEILMDAKRWSDMFPNMITSITTINIISGGADGTRDGALQLMNAELQILSPLVPTRDVSFLRFSKEVEVGVWAVVDVSINGEFQSNVKCRRLPSGFLVQDMPNGHSKVTWVEHTEYDETVVHQLFRPMLCSGMGLGAQCWISTLQRRCEALNVSFPPSSSFESAAMTPVARRNMLKLSQRLVDSFCAGMRESSLHRWTKFIDNMNGAVNVISKQNNVGVVGEPPGIVVGVSTSVWIQVSPQTLFDFLRDMSTRSTWDVLCGGQPAQEIMHLGKGQDGGNAVSLLKVLGGNGGKGMVMIQETCTDASGSMVVYAPVDGFSIQNVLGGGDPAHVELLPSGFFVQPDGTYRDGNIGGSLLTVALQLPVTSLATQTLDSMTVGKMIDFILHAIFAVKNMFGIT